MSRDENSIRHSGEELDRLLDELDHAEGASEPDHRRGHARLWYRIPRLVMSVLDQSGRATPVTVACRNISRGGIAVLHRSFMYDGTRCELRLRHKLRGETPLCATVVRCRHVRGCVHEIGMRFEREIDVFDYVDFDPLAEQYAYEAVEPSQLQGRLLVLADPGMDTAIIRHHLRESNVRIVEAQTAEEAIAQLQEDIAVMLCDYDLIGTGGLDALLETRRGGCDIPFMIMSADTSPDTRQHLRVSEVDGFLAKPINQTILFAALAEFMIGQRAARRQGGPIRTTLGASHPLHALVGKFVALARQASEEMREACVGDNVEQFRGTCNRVRGTAGTLGFPTIADAAEAALAQIGSTMSLAESDAEIRALISQCERVAA